MPFRRWIIIVCLACALLTPQHAAASAPQHPRRVAPAACPAPAMQAPVVTRHPTTQKRLALTFDADAFDAGTAKILDALRATNARVTFFLTGTWMRAHPKLVRRMLAERHQVATHGNTHVDFRRLSESEIRAQLDAAEQELVALGGRGHPFVRLPSDAYDGRVLRALCQDAYTYIFWTLDVRDAVGQPKSAAYVSDRLVNHLPDEQQRGAIILLHLGKAGTTEALPGALAQLAARGYTFVTVRDLLRPPVTPRPFNPATCHAIEIVFCDMQ